MKIAEVVCAFPPYKGGMGQSVFELSKYLSRKGADITVFTPNYQDIASEYNEGFKVRRLRPFFKFGNAAFLPQLCQRLKGYDAVHLHLPFLGGTLPVFWHLLFHSKKKLILTYHMDLVGKGIRGSIFWLYKKLVLPLVFLRANKIIVSSTDYAEHSDISAYFKKRRNKFMEIPFGVDITRFFPKAKDQNLLEKYFITPEEKVILFVGGLDEAHYFKGLEVLLRAGKILSDSGNQNFRIVVVGDGEKKHDFQNMAESYNIARNIIFAGNVPDAELAGHYNLADVFVLPSTNKGEAFGLVLLEAAACGKPLIASNLAGVRTIIEKEKIGYLAKPGDAVDLAEKIKAVISDAETAKKMGAVAAETIRENYNWEKISRELINLYKL